MAADRPYLDDWMRKRRITCSQAVRDGHVSVSREAMRKYCLPFTDGRRMIPSRKVMAEITLWTGGEVTPSHFYPPIGGRWPESASVEARV